MFIKGAFCIPVDNALKSPEEAPPTYLLTSERVNGPFSDASITSAVESTPLTTREDRIYFRNIRYWQ